MERIRRCGVQSNRKAKGGTMKTSSVRFYTLGGVLIVAALWVSAQGLQISPAKPSDHAPPAKNSRSGKGRETEPLSPVVQKGLDWLAKAQHEDGGWGAGSHAAQGIRDPHAVKTDPATTAFAAQALLRAGAYPESVARATDYLVRAVETSPEAGALITDIHDTQPQVKLGPYIDTALTAQFLSRVLADLPKDGERHRRVAASLNGCIKKLQGAQLSDGSWGSRTGWAPVLQSSLATSALEMATVAATVVDPASLERARAFQQGQFDAATGRGSGEGAAGVELYSVASAKRANAAMSRAAKELIEAARVKGDLPENAEVNEENLRASGVPGGVAGGLADAYRASDLQSGRLQEDELLRGFGTNGGEEYLSYMQTSEALVIEGGDAWDEWKASMFAKLEKIQGPDGSWTGHHCITSPVFSTAAVLQTLTADRDTELLVEAAKLTTGTGEK